MIEAMGYEKLANADHMQVQTLPGTPEGKEWLLRPGLQPKLEKKLDEHPGKLKDMTPKTKETSNPVPTKPPALSMFDDQVNIL